MAVPEFGSEVKSIMKEELRNQKNLKKIRDYEDIINFLDKEIEKYKELNGELKTVGENLNIEIDKLDVEIAVKKFQNVTWSKINEEMTEKYENNVVKMEEISMAARMKREKYCDAVDEFVDKYGIVATMNKNFDSKVRGQIAAALSGTSDTHEIATGPSESNQELISIEEDELRTIEVEVEHEKLLSEEMKAKVDSLLCVNKKLEDDYDNGFKFKRLRKALQYSRDQSMILQNEIESFEKRNNSKMSYANEKQKFLIKQKSITNYLVIREENELISGIDKVETDAPQYLNQSSSHQYGDNNLNYNECGENLVDTSLTTLPVTSQCVASEQTFKKLCSAGDVYYDILKNKRTAKLKIRQKK